MLPLVDKGDPGINYPPIIDGRVFGVIPTGVEVVPLPIADHIDTADSGSRVFQRRPSFDGVADYHDRYEIKIPYRSLKGQDRVSMELIRVSGLLHYFAMLRLVPVIYTCRSGVRRYYLPRYRRVAGHVYNGLAVAGRPVTTETFPTYASLRGVDLNVSYANGPALVDPGAGNVVFSRDADVSGVARDYTAFRIGDEVAAGDQIVVWFCPVFHMNLDSPRIQFAEAIGRESHEYLFRER